METCENLWYSGVKLRIVFLLVLHIGACVPSSIPVFVNPCNKETILGKGSGNYAADIYFSGRVHPFQPTYCFMNLVTDRGYVIAYKFENLTLNNLCAGESEHCECKNSVTVSDVHNGVTITKELCSAENAETIDYSNSKSIGNNLTFRVIMSPNASVSLQISVFSSQYVQNKGCANDEALCSNMCVHRTLACGPDKDKYCKSPDDVCSDIKSSEPNGGLIGALVGGLIAFLVVTIILTMCLRAENSFLRRKCCKLQPRANSSRANAIFTVHLANRGVASRSGENDNRAFDEYGDPIDRATYQPPPEYSSLEHIDRAGRWPDPKDGGDLPPSYEDAVQNRQQYKITINEDVNA
ncbi:uncharacterized protein LOC127872991 [Dreissena polymorpha]|uniref:Uncharacterized protein n=1 Tax=Dreissena polymorpha TaxID=45954 RepID=A0A9D4QVF0_DREPO|nr:uncharacterized protein LOC127872991 [Dreissena polymorpha]KAH3845086.1 hypothetical protein DPMN_087357 [Dreissena polymorpha]